MAESILITQCLQNDFVKPIGRYEPLPNLLHVGFDEARRLVGEAVAEGPVARMMAWANAAPDSELRIIHIRDWHDADDPRQAAHLRQFGPHCIRDTRGAEFVFPAPKNGGAQPLVIDSLGLNDFHGTALAAALEPLAEYPRRVGLMGVWTDAKIGFLAYELATRYPKFEIGICSALTASSSRAQHFLALAQLKKILDVELFASVGEFIRFLGGASEEIPLSLPKEGMPAITFAGDVKLCDDDYKLLRYLYRSSRTVSARVLDGGFSGNVVLGTESTDLHGHKEVAHVVKIGEGENIGRERSSFEQIESVLGNAAPRVVDFADYGGRGALKYRYASMGGSFSTTFQKLYMGGLEALEVERILDTVFEEQLGRLYAAAKREACNLLEHYWFSAKWAPNVRARVEGIIGGPAAEGEIEVAPGVRVANLCLFYEKHLNGLLPRARRSHYMSFVHGDLNGANIIVDGRKNVWIIDYFHTARAHVLKDLIKLENDLLYIFTPLRDETDLREAFRLSDHLLAVRDLGVPLPELPESEVGRPELRRAFSTAQKLRAFYPALIRSDRDPLQLLAAQLRYAVHTLSFDESSTLQKRWALYTACRASELVAAALNRSDRLRLDWLDSPLLGEGRVALTILPGRGDSGRNLDNDLDVMRSEGVTHIVSLIPRDELERYGVPQLLHSYAANNFAAYELPIPDQGVCAASDMNEALAWMRQALVEGRTIAVHCVGGLGRSGTLCACLLKSLGAGTDDAVNTVRGARGERAIETPEQLNFVETYSG